MKKQLLALAAALTVISVSVPIYGAASPTEDVIYEKLDQGDIYSDKALGLVGNIASDKVTAKDRSTGKALKLDVTPVGDDDILLSDETAYAIVNQAMIDGTIEDITDEDTEIIASVLGMVDVKSNDAFSSAEIRIPVSQVKSGESIAVLQYVGGEWQPVKITQVGNGYVTVVVDQMAPLAVVKLESGAIESKGTEIEDTEIEDEDIESEEIEDTGKKTSTETTDDGKKTSDSDKGKGTSAVPSGKNQAARISNAQAVKNNFAAPKTGDTMILYVLAGVAAVALIGVVFIAIRLIQKKI